MKEIERTFLAREIPDISRCRTEEIIDIYIPRNARHPKLRIRKKGNKYEITNKQPVREDASEQEEQTIILSKEEFDALLGADGKKVRKIRHFYSWNGKTAEIDVFQGPLEGLVLVDFEFSSLEERDSFEIPDFCLAEVTQEEFVAGGMLCGKSYGEIEKDLKRFGYRKLLPDK